jgi:outer membrane protein assembly factor BamB
VLAGLVVVVAGISYAVHGGHGPTKGVEPGSGLTPAPSTGPSPAPALSAVRPFAGLMVIADRGNDRLLVMNAQKRVVWTYPAKNLPPPPYRLYFPDDAFWVHAGHAILVNEEENDTLIEIAYPSGRVLWTYGHPGVAGSAPGYLHQPDDLYPLPNGALVVADAMNCRILFLSPKGKPTRQIGTTGNCTPALPTTIGYPNGDTPLPNGNLLISQIKGAFIDEVTPRGHVVWQVHLPGVTFPSDPQPMPNGRGYMVSDYANPGGVVVFTNTGQILWSYHPRSGAGMLDHPSLATPLPNGLVGINDDYHNRVILIDPKTNRIVWQYGVTGKVGTAHGYLSAPDGFDLLLPNGTTPIHLDFPNSKVHRGRP